jgi:hypothetical protein
VNQELAQLAAQLADAREQRKRWEDLEKTYLQALLDGHTAGEVPTSFTAAGLAFKLQAGRKTTLYPDSVSAQIKLIQTKAVEDGLTQVKVGAPFWRITEPGAAV